MNEGSTNALYVILLLAVMAIMIGVGYLVPAGDCQRVGTTMQVNWMYDPVKGCFIQQPGGSWVPIDNNRIYQP